MDWTFCAEYKDKKICPVLDGYGWTGNKSEFKETLLRWLEKWIPEVSLPLAARWEELYGNVAVGIFLKRWSECERSNRSVRRSQLERAAGGDDVDVTEIYKEQEFEASQALYRLLVATPMD